MRVSAARELDAFLLAVEWRDTARGVELTLWGSSPANGPVRATITEQEAVMFVPRFVETQAGRRVPRPLKSREGADVDALYFTSQRALLQERDRIHAASGRTLDKLTPVEASHACFLPGYDGLSPLCRYSCHFGGKAATVTMRA